MSSGALQIRPFDHADWDAVRDIYQQGIATRNATFQLQGKTWDEWNASVLEDCRLVAVGDGRVVGWAGLYGVSTRAVYRGVAEVSVYVSPAAWGQGVGRALLTHLVAASEQAGYWTLQASIFPENTASLALHSRCGFRIVGRRERIGQMEGRWRDTLLLERRSAVVEA